MRGVFRTFGVDMVRDKLFTCLILPEGYAASFHLFRLRQVSKNEVRLDR